LMAIPQMHPRSTRMRPAEIRNELLDFSSALMIP
jgi:hypothetical protein